MLSSARDDIVDNSVDLKLYPNPVDDYLQFRISGGDQIQTISLFNLQGQLLNKIDDVFTNEIYVGHLSAGMYIFELVLDDSRKGAHLFVKE